jgi:hypothetical protein
MIDSCRPGSEDVHDAVMQPLAEAIARDEEVGRAYQATQRADATIAKAFRTVSPPEGLAARLLDNVEAATEQEVEAKPEPISPPSRDRRRLLVWGPIIGIALAACVTAFVFYAPSAAELDVSSDEARNATVAQWVAEAKEVDGWHDASTLPAGFTGPQQVSAGLSGWKLVDGGQTVCYPLVTGKNQLALLFVTKRSTTGLPTAPMLPVATAYQGTFLTTAWAAKGHVYVLAVSVSEGSARELFRQVISVQAA